MCGFSPAHHCRAVWLPSCSWRWVSCFGSWKWLSGFLFLYITYHWCVLGAKGGSQSLNLLCHPDWKFFSAYFLSILFLLPFVRLTLFLVTCYFLSLYLTLVSSWDSWHIVFICLFGIFFSPPSPLEYMFHEDSSLFCSLLYF